MTVPRVFGSVSSDTTGSLSSSITLASYTYNANGNLARMNYPNGQYVTYEYDLLDRLVREMYHNSDDSVSADYRYVYNANGNITVIKEAYTSGSTIAYRPVVEYTYCL